MAHQHIFDDGACVQCGVAREYALDARLDALQMALSEAIKALVTVAESVMEVTPVGYTIVRLSPEHRALVNDAVARGRRELEQSGTFTGYYPEYVAK